MACKRKQQAYDSACRQFADAEQRTRESQLDYIHAVNWFTASSMGLILGLAGLGPMALVKLIRTGIGLGIGLATNKHAQDGVDKARAHYLSARAAEDRALEKCGVTRAALLDCLNHREQYGCGSRGGPGWRRTDGKCASWEDWYEACGT